MDRKFKVTRKDDNKMNFSIRLEKELVDKVDAIAKKTERSRNDVFRLCIEFAVNSFEEDIKVAEKPTKSSDAKVY
ncbi:MAG: ribbon-helix-helix domain-containing protein [Clostridia bacterium]